MQGRREKEQKKTKRLFFCDASVIIEKSAPNAARFGPFSTENSNNALSKEKTR